MPPEDEPADPVEDDLDGFSGSLLVAHPGLRDPNFRRGVLYLTAHSRADGAMGVILNRPLPGKTAADLLPEHDAIETLTRIPVYLGGPVGRDQLTFGALRVSPAGADGDPEEITFRHHLTLPEALDLAGDNVGADTAQAAGLRAFVGYAGWTGGQLEGEIEANAWVLVPPRPRFFAPPPKPDGEDRAWFRVMSTLGPTYKLLAAVPDDLTSN